MREYEKNFDYANDDGDEESVGNGYVDGFENGEEDFGELSFGMSKNEAVNLIEKLFTMPEEIRSFSNITTQLSKNSTYNYLTKANIEEILNYAINKGMIKPFYKDYIRTY